MTTFAAEIAASDYNLPEQTPLPEIESEVNFFARLKAITDDPNKSPAQKQRERKAEFNARHDRQRQIDWANECRLARHDQDAENDALEFDIPDVVKDDRLSKNLI